MELHVSNEVELNQESEQLLQQEKAPLSAVWALQLDLNTYRE